MYSNLTLVLNASIWSIDGTQTGYSRPGGDVIDFETRVALSAEV